MRRGGIIHPNRGVQNITVMIDNNDLYYMRRALALAAKGQFSTSPNPSVGCVIVKENNIVGEGYHSRAGAPHAEIGALRQAKEKSIGAVLYVTLEPCAHSGRTPPCVQAVIESGVVRVVIAIEDPNPLVSGKGIQRLKDAGIEVNVGVLVEEAKQLNIAFLKRMHFKKPYVRLKLASSLDGKIALSSGKSQWITGVKSRQDVQRFRAKSCAILSTSVTVIADKSRLNVRWSELPEDIQKHYLQKEPRQPVRIILDAKQRLTGKEPLFNMKGDILLVTKCLYKIAFPASVTILIDPTPGKKINLNWLFTQLGNREINSVWVEAGAKLSGSLIEGQHIDELILYLAPTLLGCDAKDLCDFPKLLSLSDAPHFHIIGHDYIGEDIRLRLIPKNLPTKE